MSEKALSGSKPPEIQSWVLFKDDGSECYLPFSLEEQVEPAMERDGFAAVPASLWRLREPPRNALWRCGPGPRVKCFKIREA